MMEMIGSGICREFISDIIKKHGIINITKYGILKDLNEFDFSALYIILFAIAMDKLIFYRIVELFM